MRNQRREYKIEGMDVQTISQPFGDDERAQTLGSILEQLLSREEVVYRGIWIISAWVSQKSFLRLASFINRHKNHGADIHIYFGINLQGTSIEAARAINQYHVDSRVLYNLRNSHTFHPKIYLLEADTEADLIIGSNNLTEGGMYTNYEAAAKMRFVLPIDQQSYQDMKADLNIFLNPPIRISGSLNEQLIKRLIRLNLIVPEKLARRNRAKSSRSHFAPNGIVEIPFESVPIPRAPVFEIAQPSNIPFGGIIQAAAEDMELLWRKEDLPASDVQRQPGHATGGLRLTQAGWQANGVLIDQTTFFRQELFGEWSWTIGERAPTSRETTQISCEVHILGRDYDIHQLTISHKPGGEAGQRNYTTMLHWGTLANLIRDQNLTGRTLELFRLNENDEADYRIVIR